MIHVDADALAPALCESIIARFETDPRKSAGGVIGVGSPKRSTDLGIARLAGWEDVARELDRAIVASAHRYRDKYPTLGRVLREIRYTGFQIQRYLPGGDDGFDWHADRINLATADRVLALVLYLNTVAEAGETEFLVQKLRVQPRAGAALWFPPSFEYLHRGNTPRGGPKYVVTTFLVDPP